MCIDIIKTSKLFTVSLFLSIGKSGVVASRFAASLSSVGIPAHYVHATEWLHGDLGEWSSGIYKWVEFRASEWFSYLQMAWIQIIDKER